MAKNKLGATSFGASPRADLLPPRQRAELVHERTMPKLLLAVLGSAIVAGLLFLLGGLPTQLLSDRLAAAEGESSELYEELASHAETQNFKESSEAIAAQIVPLIDREVSFGEQFERVQTALPEGAIITQFRIELTDGATLEAGLCDASAVLVSLTVSTSALTGTAETLTALRALEGAVCAEALQANSLGDGATTATLQLVLDESVRVDRVTEGGQS